ncbi:MAG: putative lipid II flippase FtsW [Candidatus Shapirobacteria bacterium]
MFRRFKFRPDWWLIIVVWGLALFGLVMVGDVSVVEAYRGFGSEWHFLRLQFGWMILGLGVFLAACLIPLEKLEEKAFLILVLNLVLLVLVLIPGLGQQVLGARRRFSFGGVSLQPAELVKMSLALYLSAYFKEKKKIGPFLLVTASVVGLVMLEPDLGTAIVVMLIGLAIYFASGSPVWQNLLVVVAGAAASLILIWSSSYRLERLKTFLNPERDPLGASYHIRQVLLALGSGGVFGVGLGQSRQKYDYLPEVSTDSIFAVIGEELGFVGAFLVVAAFVFLVWRGLRAARKAPRRFEQLLALAITVWLGSQAFLNMASMVALVPLTGIPLPFISYGGSALVLSLGAAGLLVNISRNRQAR